MRWAGTASSASRWTATRSQQPRTRADAASRSSRARLGDRRHEHARRVGAGRGAQAYLGNGHGHRRRVRESDRRAEVDPAGGVDLGLRAVRERRLEHVHSRNAPIKSRSSSTRSSRATAIRRAGASTANHTRTVESPPLEAGRRYRLVMKNLSTDDHPIHLHRHTFEVTSVGRREYLRGLIKDVLLDSRAKDVGGGVHRRSSRQYAVSLPPAGPHGSRFHDGVPLCLSRAEPSKLRVSDVSRLMRGLCPDRAASSSCLMPALRATTRSRSTARTPWSRKNLMVELHSNFTPEGQKYSSTASTPPTTRSTRRWS